MTERPATKLEDLPINPYIEWMHEQWQKDKEHLWPKAPLKPRASEQRLGEGYLTVTNSSVIFESRQGDTVGFDLPNLRVVRLVDRDDFEVVYSVQGEMKKATFKVVVTSARSGRELPTAMETGGALTIIINGATVARFLSDHSSAQTEGTKKWTDEELNSKLKRAQEIITTLPSNDELWAEEISGRTWEPSPESTLTYRNASGRLEMEEKIFPELEKACAHGFVSPEQRMRIQSMIAKWCLRNHEQKYLYHDENNVTIPEGWKKVAEDSVNVESLLGNDLMFYLKN